MQTLQKPTNPINDGKSPLSSKGAAVLGAAVAVILAALVIVLFLKQYRDNINEDGVPTPVLVATQLVEQGASGDSLGGAGMFKATEVPRDQVKPGAFTDAGLLRGKVAVGDILPGQQLTRADFAAGVGPVTKLGAEERAVTLTLDASHGLSGVVRPGDHVDVLAGFLVDRGVNGQRPVLRVLLQNVLILTTPVAATGGGIGRSTAKSNEVTVRVASTDAPRLAFAADNGTLRLVLRPQNGENIDRRTLVTLESVLLGAQVIRPEQRGSGR